MFWGNYLKNGELHSTAQWYQRLWSKSQTTNFTHIGWIIFRVLKVYTILKWHLLTMFMQTSRSKVCLQSKNVSYSMYSRIKQLKVNRGWSAQNLSLSEMLILPLCVRLGLIMMLYSVRQSLEKFEDAQAIALLENEYTQRTVAESFDVLSSVVARLWRLYQETGEFTRWEGHGWHGMTS